MGFCLFGVIFAVIVFVLGFGVGGFVCFSFLVGSRFFVKAEETNRKLISMYYCNVTTCLCSGQIKLLILATHFIYNSTIFLLDFHVATFIFFLEVSK